MEIRAWVNGSPTTVSVLAQLGALLVDLHGQHRPVPAAAKTPSATCSMPTPMQRWSGRRCAMPMNVCASSSGARRTSRRDARTWAASRLPPACGRRNRACGARTAEVETLDVEAKRLAHADELGRLSRELEQALDTALSRAAKLVGA